MENPEVNAVPLAARTKEDHHFPQTIEAEMIEDLEVVTEIECIEFELGDHVVYPYPRRAARRPQEGGGRWRCPRRMSRVPDDQDSGHNDMTVKVPTENAGIAGLRQA